MAGRGSPSERDAGPAREIPFGAAYDRSIGGRYPSNFIKTSKYTVPSFLPLNIMEQFKKAANVYFLVISLAMFLGKGANLFVTSVSGWSTLGPLALMLAVSAVIAAVDDVRRHQSDAKTNKQKARAIRMGGHHGVYLDTLAWACISVGDVLVLKGEEELPADMVPIACSGTDGLCYVSTANLDGETNLKIKYAAPAAQAALCDCAEGAHASCGPPLLNQAVERFASLDGLIRAEAPNTSIHSFSGSLALGASAASAAVEEGLGADHLLLRGTQLRNTAWCFGVVVYTGPDTRMVKNSRKAPMKLANLERVVNRAMLIVLGTQVALALFSDCCYVATKQRFLSYWYLFPDKASGHGATIVLPPIVGYWFTFFILYSNLMPISLYATMEVCNFAQAYFVKSDLGMYDEEQDTPALVRSTNLCHELGQVSYVFSDKTGTLTQNIMELKRVSVAGAIYGELGSGSGFNGGPELDAAKRAAPQVAAAADAFLEVLAVSHTVMVTQDQRGIVRYEAESPDEGALVEATRQLGWDFKTRSGQAMTVEVTDSSSGGVRQRGYRLLALNAFTSARKRMSVVAETPEGELLLLVKGADNVMLERAGRPDQVQEMQLQNHLTDFAQDGLRTLVLGRRKLLRAEFETWYREYEHAQGAMQDRGALLEAAAARLEVGLEILGATAIEDRLQEGVPETIVSLRQAGVHLWVLTGDKLETARNIGFSARVLSNDMDVMVLDGLVPATTPSAASSGIGGSRSSDQARKDQLAELSRRARAAAEEGIEAALMVTGRALEQLAESKGLTKDFLDVATSCKVVIACRVSPAQKAQMVRLVRKGIHPQPVTLAIGDGANDVPMIQQAQVGVGISGREGRQAVNASDFAIAQFRYLQRLLLVHGRWNYRRMCKFVLYSFWKNAVLTLLLFYYTFISGYSGTSMFTSLVWTSFNVILGWPVIATGICDRDVTDSEALQNPSLYETGRLGLDLNLAKMTEMLASALVHSMIILLVVLLAFKRMQCTAIGDYYTFGTVIYTWLIIAMNYRVIFITTTMNWVFAVAVTSSFAMYALFMIVYCTVEYLEPFMYMVIFQIAREPLFWVGCVAVPALAMALDIFKAYLLLEFMPDQRDLALERAKASKMSSLMPRPSRLPDGRAAAASATSLTVLSGVSTPSSGVFSTFHFDHPETEPRLPQFLTTVRHVLAGDTSFLDRLRHTANASDYPEAVVTRFDSEGEHPRRGKKSQRPSGTRFAQQRLPSYTFVLTWRGVLFAAVSTGTLLLVLGIIIFAASTYVAKLMVQYDGRPDHLPLGAAKEEVVYHNCSVPAGGLTRSCLLNFTVMGDMEPPIYIIYEVDPFYQNYNSYMQSVVYEELRGDPMNKGLRRSACQAKSTRLTPAGDHIYPCGLIATSVFNDTFEILGIPINTQDPISLMKTDHGRFSNPVDWRSWRHMSWLYERYPTLTTPELGVKSRQFTSWMLPEFFGHVANYYGVVRRPLRRGETLSMRINASFPVTSLDARKQVLLMTPGWLGGRNFALAVFFMASGGVCFAMAVVIVAIHWLCPRQPGRHRFPSDRHGSGRACGESSGDEEDTGESSTDYSGSGSSDSC